MSIELTSDQGAMLYLLVTLTALFVLWGWQGHKKRPPLPPRQQLTICEYCLSPYLIQRPKAVTRCPGCGSWNKHTPH